MPCKKGKAFCFKKDKEKRNPAVLTVSKFKASYNRMSGQALKEARTLHNSYNTGLDGQVLKAALQQIQQENAGFKAAFLDSMMGSANSTETGSDPNQKDL